MAEDDLFAAPVGDEEGDMFGAVVEEVDASDVATGGDDDMFGAPVEDISADVAATDDADDMFGAPADTGDGGDMFGEPAPVEQFEEPAPVEQCEDVVAEPEAPQESARIVWSRKFRAIIDDRASEERKLLFARREKAAAELKEYMERREEHKISTAARNRQEESDFLIQIAEEKDNDNPWSRVVNMIETQANADENRTDPKRLRSVLIQLKNKPLKKAAPSDDEITM